jgi:hypothetical protein
MNSTSLLLSHPKSSVVQELSIVRLCNLYNSVAVKYPELDFSLIFSIFKVTEVYFYVLKFM